MRGASSYGVLMEARAGGRVAGEEISVSSSFSGFFSEIKMRDIASEIRV